ncbi:MAG: hypothetical protein DBX91_14040 [Subdoligranulum variabile]|uniref:hypothetical protein n=1 Tax=Gemmiger formicilis TaxID=745368 RepID=UPI000D7A3F6C|nr:MAG: hypothetical protein DBX91_14040 [Subdoligranulum variabile]
MTINEAIEGYQRDVLALVQKYALHPALACVLLQNCEHIMRDVARQADAQEHEKQQEKAAPAEKGGD